MLIVRKIISMEKKLSTASDIKKVWATCISLMEKMGLSVLTLNMIHKNHHVTELNKQGHWLVAKNKKITINLKLKNWKR
jgi:hypothetical protein